MKRTYYKQKWWKNYHTQKLILTTSRSNIFPNIYIGCLYNLISIQNVHACFSLILKKDNVDETKTKNIPQKTILFLSVFYFWKRFILNIWYLFISCFNLFNRFSFLLFFCLDHFWCIKYFVIACICLIFKHIICISKALFSIKTKTTDYVNAILIHLVSCVLYSICCNGKLLSIRSDYFCTLLELIWKCRKCFVV